MSPSLSAHHPEASSALLRRRWRTVHGDGVDLATLELGDPHRPTVVLVHGWPDTHRVWLGVAERLAWTHHVVLYDTRARGASPTHAPGADVSLAALAQDLRDVLDATSPGSRAHVVGHDWGSVQAWEAVCEAWAGERIASFTSLSGPNLDHVSHWLRGLARHPSPSGLVGALGQAASSSYVAGLVSPAAPLVLRAAGAGDAARGLAYYRANLGLGPWRGRPTRERRTDVPVLQLGLTRDPAVRRASLTASERWCAALRRTSLRVGHWAPRTHPDLVAREISEHVRATEA